MMTGVSPRGRAAVLAVVAVVALMWGSPADTAAAAHPIAAAGSLLSQGSVPTTQLMPLEPCRLFDGRQTPDFGRIDASTRQLEVAGRCGVPATARAVAISMVATGTTAAGFVTVHPHGSPRPEASNLNFVTGNTVANSAVVKLGDSGSIDFYMSAQADIIVDITAAFVDAPTAVSAGRFVGVDPVRVVDTRRSGERGVGEIRVPLPANIPPDATAVVANVTAVGASSSGFLSAYPAGSGGSPTSIVNTDEHNDTRANVVFISVDPEGFVVSRSMETDVLVDVTGWFTGPSAPASTDGLFVPQEPTRVWDSRYSADPIHRGGTVERQVLGAPAAAVVANVTVVDPTGWGFVSVYAAGAPVPNVSSLNYRWRQPVAALTVSRVSERGVAISSYAGVHGLVDVAGWFTGDPAAASGPPPVNAPPLPHTPVVMISDSSFAGIRWGGALGSLQGALWDARLESCRRLVGASCRGREGYAPLNAVQELSTTVPGANRALVVATGYNDVAWTFPIGVDALIQQARAKGIDRVIWLTYRENAGYVSPGGISNSASFSANNAFLRSVAASGRYPELILADWDFYSRTRPSWLTSDGVHLTTAGALEAAAYVSRKFAFLERRPCPPGLGGPTTQGGWCADPDVTGPPG
jgi:hypothetical protein